MHLHYEVLLFESFIELSIANLLIQGHFLHVHLDFCTQVGLLCTNGHWSTLFQISVEAHAKSAPGVKQALKAPDPHRIIIKVRDTSMKYNLAMEDQHMPNL